MIRYGTKEKIEQGITKALEENKTVFHSKQEFADYCKVSTSVISNELIKKIEDKGIIIIVQNFTEEKKVTLGITKALEENKTVFHSKQEFADYCKVTASVISNKVIEKAEDKGIIINVQKSPKKKSQETREKIELGTNKALKENRTFFNKKQDFADYCKVSASMISNELIKKAEDRGIIIIVQKSSRKNSQETKEKIELYINKALEENKTFFNTKQEFANYCKIFGSMISNELVKKVGDRGIIISTQKSQKKKSQETKEKIELGINRALEENRFFFNSRRFFAEYCKVSPGVISNELVNKVGDRGIIISVQKSPKKRKQESREKIELGINKALKENRTFFNTKQEFIDYCEVSSNVISNEIIKKVNDIGITINIRSSLKKKSLESKEKIEKGMAKALKEDRTIFNTRQKFADYCKVSSRVISNEIIKKAKDKNIVIHVQKSTRQKGQESKEKIEKGIIKAIEENKTTFNSRKEFADYCGVYMNRINSELIENLRDKNILIKIKESTKNYIFVLEKIIDFNLTISHESVKEFADDILNIKIKDISKDDINLYTYKNNHNELSNKEKVRIIEKALIELIDYKNKLSIFEIKLQILKLGYYFNEEIIKSLLNLKTIETEDSIDAVIRFSQEFCNLKIIDLKYTLKIPLLNTSFNGTLYINSNIKNKFIYLWKKFIFFLIENKMCNDIIKLPLLPSWKKNFDKLLMQQLNLKKAFLLDENISFLEDNGFEIMAVAAFLGKKKANEFTPNIFSKLDPIYSKLSDNASLFFIWLTMKELALSHPKFLTMTNIKHMSNSITKVTEKHILFKVLEKSSSSNFITENFKKSLAYKKNQLHLFQIISATNPTCDFNNITSEECNQYLNSSLYYTGISDDIKNHGTYFQNICLSIGNNKISISNNNNSIDIELNEMIIFSDISRKTKKKYFELTEKAKKQILYYKVGNNYKISFMKAYLILLDFLDNFKKEISAQKMERILNIEYEDEEEIHLSKWLKDNGLESRFILGQLFLVKLFESSPIKKYKRVFKQAVIHKKNKNRRKFIRGGFSQAVYHTIQKVAFETPAICKNFPIMRTTFKGENVDMQWWDNRCVNSINNTSPIMATCIWLMTKLPRRSIHIRNLDVKNFLQYDKQGNIEGFFINSDKNKNTSQDDRNFIPKFLLLFIFSDEEFKYIERYINYIKSIFKDMPKQKYTGDTHDELIQPLFPGIDNQSIMNKEHIYNMYNKTLAITQIKIRGLAETNYYDKYYNKDEKEGKKSDLKKIELLKKRKIKKKINEIPRSTIELENLDYSDSIWNSNFKAYDGIHNLRHAGASSLFADGLSFDAITFITGHIDDRVLKRVYMHYREEDHRKVMKRISPAISNQLNNIKIKEPNIYSNLFIKSLNFNNYSNINQAYTLEQLKQNGYISLKRTITSTEKEIYGEIGEVIVENGLEIASKFDPLTMWQEQNHGFCTINRQCPQGTYEECSLCPHLIFNSGHIEGVLHKIKELSIKLSLLGRLSYNSTISGTNTERKEIEKKFNIIISSLYGYYAILKLIEKQISSALDISENINKLITDDSIQDKIFQFYNITYDEANLDLISSARDLNISNVTTNHSITEMCFKALKKASMDGNQKTIDEISKKGIVMILDKWNKASNQTKKQLIEFYFKDDNKKALDKKEY